MIISRTIGMRSSLKNMCSVRTRPMPSAPNSRALRGVLRRVGVGPHPRRGGAARPSRGAPGTRRRARGRPAAARPATTSPVAPFSVIVWPSRTRRDRPRGRGRRSSSTTTSPAPTTQHLPQPRATTAACDVSPPRDGEDALRGVHAGHVLRRRLGAHQDRPPRSRSAISTAFSGSNTTRPTAAAGVAGEPLADGACSAPPGPRSSRRSWWSEAGSTRRQRRASGR